MGEERVADIIAHNAAQNEDIIVSRFSVEAHRVVELMPKYFVSCWVPRADFYVIVQDKWPSVFYYEDIAEKYGNDQKVMYVGEDMDVCAEHVRRWNNPVSFGSFSNGTHSTAMRLDVGLPYGPDYKQHLDYTVAAFGNIERLRYASISTLYATHFLYQRSFNVWSPNSS